MLTSGTAFAQILTIALTPIVTRIYPPEEYGVLSIYVTIVTLISIGAALDYQLAIPIAKNEENAYNIIVLACSVLLIVSIVIVILLLIGGEWFLNILNSPTLVDYMYLIPLGIFFVTLYKILMAWSQRVKDFKSITKTKITQSIFSNIGRIGFGFMNLGPVGLLLSHIIGQSGGISRLSKPLIIRRKEFSKSISFSKIMYMARRYIRFPLYSAPSNYVYTAGNQAPIIALAAIFGPSVVGLFGLAKSMVSLPVSLISNSVSQVFYSEIASIGKGNPKKIKELTLKLASKLAIIGLIPLIVLISLGPFLFTIAFGEDWHDAGVFARMLAIVAFAEFVIFPLGKVTGGVLEKPYIGLSINSIRLISVVLAFILAYQFGFSANLTVLIYTIVVVISYVVTFISIQVVLNNEIKKMEIKFIKN